VNLIHLFTSGPEELWCSATPPGTLTMRSYERIFGRISQRDAEADSSIRAGTSFSGDELRIATPIQIDVQGVESNRLYVSRKVEAELHKLDFLRDVPSFSLTFIRPSK